MTRNLIALGIAVALLTGCEKPKKAKPTANEQAPVANAQPGGNAGGGAGLGGGGTVNAIRGAVKNVVDSNDMRNIYLLIEDYSITGGKMPSSNVTYELIKKESRKLAEKVDDGSITLCSPKSREEIWAYETDALKNGGWVCTSAGQEKMDAVTLKQRLGK